LVSMKGKVKKARIDAWPSRKHLENRVKQVEAEMTLRRLDALLEWMPPAPLRLRGEDHRA